MDRRADSQTLSLTRPQHEAAAQTWRAATGLVASGVQSAGLGRTGELLRAVHSARAVGLPRLASSGQRVAQQVRALHARQPEFRLASLGWDTYQLLATAHALQSAPTVEARWVGAARRPYTEVGTLHLFGLYSAPVVSAGGYFGAESLLVDDAGTIWSLSNVSPGDAFDCQFAYIGPFEFGGVTLDHRTVGRAALDLEHATAAANRRLGTGRGVTATLADGVTWWESPVARLWDQPLAEQVDRAWSGRSADATERVAGNDLLFARGRVLGPAADAVLLETGSIVLRGVAPSAHAELTYRRNLTTLARGVGTEVWSVGRTVFGRPRTVQLLAVGGPALPLPTEMRGRVNLGLDTLELPPVQGLVAPRPDDDVAAEDPLDPLKRRLEQILLGGRSTVSPTTWDGFRSDEARLQRNHMPTGAALLARLRASAADTDDLAVAWLAAKLYVTAAEERLQRASWLLSS